MLSPACVIRPPSITMAELWSDYTSPLTYIPTPFLEITLPSIWILSNSDYTAPLTCIPTSSSEIMSPFSDIPNPLVDLTSP